MESNALRYFRRPALENIFEYQNYWGGGGGGGMVQININIYFKCYLNNKKTNAAEKHGRDVSFYGVAVMCSFIRDTRGRTRAEH